MAKDMHSNVLKMLDNDTSKLVEKLAINIDELELSAGAEEMLFRNQIFTIKDFVDAVDAGKNVDSFDGTTEENAEEILQAMKAIGYVE